MSDLPWSIELREDNSMYELKERDAHRGMFQVFEHALANAHRMEVANSEINFINIPAHFLPEEINPLTSMDNRASIAEAMLDNYHLLKTNLKTRQAIYHTLCSQQASELRRGAAWQLVQQAQAELDQQKFEILELMGVDS